MDNLFIFDLPTHLPNETPKEPELASESQNRVPVNIETGKQNQIDHHVMRMRKTIMIMRKHFPKQTEQYTFKAQISVYKLKKI